MNLKSGDTIEYFEGYYKVVHNAISEKGKPYKKTRGSYPNIRMVQEVLAAEGEDAETITRISEELLLENQKAESVKWHIDKANREKEKAKRDSVK